MRDLLLLGFFSDVNDSALKRQFPRNKAFAALHDDPEFLQLVK